MSDTSTEEELKDAHAKALGNQQFALSNFGYIGADFDPNTHVNERMQTKGVLTRQPVGGSRISITSMVTLAPTCP